MTRKGDTKSAKMASEVVSGRRSYVTHLNLPNFIFQERACNPQHCKKEGCSMMTLDNKKELFSAFYAMNYNEQSAYLVKCMTMQKA